MKKIILFASLLMCLTLTACSTKKANHKVQKYQPVTVRSSAGKYYEADHRIIVKTFGDYMMSDNASSLDKKTSGFLASIKGLNNYRIKIITGTYADINHGSNNRYETIILIRKQGKEK